MSYQRRNNDETTLCNVEKRCFDVAQGWFNFVLTLYTDIVPMSWTLKVRFRVLLHFQRRINIIWTVIYNVELTLIQRWNVGRVVSIKKFILRNLLLATLLTKWNLSVFFMDYAKKFTTPVFTNFFWWLLLRIRLR